VSQTVRTRNDWDQQLVEVRRRGFVVSTSESFDNVTSIAVPILNLERRSVGAVSVQGWSAPDPSGAGAARPLWCCTIALSR
jgi:DNA-binding IclR family transcriptional regulator